MKTLPFVRATPEQLPLLSQNRFGVEVICGAAGSGKTSCALLRLRSLSYFFAARQARMESREPVRVLVLTFNRTLAGYIQTLANHQIDATLNIDLEIQTFAGWAQSRLDLKLANKEAEELLDKLASSLAVLKPSYIRKEVDYLLGRFLPEDVESYITAERTGRGTLPRVERSLRRRILDEVVYPYMGWLAERGESDWNGLAVSMAQRSNSLSYDIVVVDESQDFSANQLRAVARHIAEDHTVTFVIDTVQRIYARGFTWNEAGFDVRPERIHKLLTNHRNTVEIAAFAAGVLSGLTVDGDGALPNLHSAYNHGPLPSVLKGRYSDQVAWAINYIKESVNLSQESVVFLKARGGAWFNEIRNTLAAYGMNYAEITREKEWPEGPENVALSTFHSAKGLEFDYVFIIGLASQNTPFDEEELDDEVIVLRKLLAVAIARARKAVFIGYKPGEESELIRFFQPGTFTEVML